MVERARGAAGVVIRTATAADAAALAALGARTFVDAFAADNRPEDVDAHLAATFGAEQQAAELADPASRYVVADVDGVLAGYALLQAGAPPPPCVLEPEPLELVRFYVDRPWHGRGVAQALMGACIAAARDLGAQTLWLSVWERNPRAQAFYAKCGFRQVGTHPFLLGADLQTDQILVRDLGDGR